MAEVFDMSCLRCDCSDWINQTCDRCAARAHIEALQEEIGLLRARAPRKYILARKSEWTRLFREVHGYLRTCHRQHGTDWEGRNHAMNALTEAMEFMGADDAAREVKLAALREAEIANSPPTTIAPTGNVDGEHDG